MALDEDRTTGETGHNSDHNFLAKLYNAAVAAGAYDEGGEWSGSGASVEVIAEEVLASDAANIDFTSIPADYRHLRVELLARCAGAVTTSSVLMGFNGDTGANYQQQRLVGTGTASASTGSTRQVANINGDNAPAGMATPVDSFIPHYAGTDFHKGSITRFAMRWGATDTQIGTYGMWWENTAAINQLTLTLGGGDFKAGTVVTLYGIKGA